MSNKKSVGSQKVFRKSLQVRWHLSDTNIDHVIELSIAVAL